MDDFTRYEASVHLLKIRGAVVSAHMSTPAPGPWGIILWTDSQVTNDGVWRIANTKTGAVVQIGKVSKRGVNFYDRAVAECKRRNEAVKGRPECKALTPRDGGKYPALLTGSRRYQIAHIWRGADHWLLSDGDPFETEFLIVGDDPAWIEQEARRNWAERVRLSKPIATDES